MRLLEIFTDNQLLFIEENNKKYKKNLNNINNLLNSFCSKYNEYTSFINSENYINKISLAKALNTFFQAKKLKLDIILEQIKQLENNKLSEFNRIKTSLLNELNVINNPTEGVVCLFNIENGEFVRCDENKEIVILGEHNNIINNIIQMVENINIYGKFEDIPSHQVSYNTTLLESNIMMCKTKADVAYADKQSKLHKLNEVINNLDEVGNKIVAFYTYKDKLEMIGCTSKFIKDYEKELEKLYTPLKKTLEKELNLELKDIWNVTENESSYNSSNNTFEDNSISSVSTVNNDPPFEIPQEDFYQPQPDFINDDTFTQPQSQIFNTDTFDQSQIEPLNTDTSVEPTETIYSSNQETPYYDNRIVGNNNDYNTNLNNEINLFENMVSSDNEESSYNTQFTSPLSNMQNQTETQADNIENTDSNPFSSVFNNIYENNLDSNTTTDNNDDNSNNDQF